MLNFLKSWMRILSAETWLNLVGRIPPFLFIEMGVRGRNLSVLCFTPITGANLHAHSTVETALFSSLSLQTHQVV